MPNTELIPELTAAADSLMEYCKTLDEPPDGISVEKDQLLDALAYMHRARNHLSNAVYIQETKKKK